LGGNWFRSQNNLVLQLVAEDYHQVQADFDPLDPSKLIEGEDVDDRDRP